MVNELSKKEHFQIFLKEIIKEVPYLNFLFNWYESCTDEIERKQMIEFIEGLAETVKELELDIDRLSQELQITIALAMKKVLENIKIEIIQEKRIAYLKYMKNLFIDCTEDDISLSKVELYLTTLENLTRLEIQILHEVFRSPDINLTDIQIEKVDSYLTYSMARVLIQKGLIKKGSRTTVIYLEEGGHGEDTKVSVSDFGNDFIKYCLDTDYIS